MAGNKDRVYWNDSKTTVRKRLGLEDNEDFSTFKVGMFRRAVKPPDSVFSS